MKYELKTFKRRSDKLAPTELKQIHPLGKSPLLTLEPPGATEPIVLAESGAIVEYLCDHFGSAKPTLVPERYKPGLEGQVGGESEEWMRYRYFMHYTEGSLMPFLVMTLVNDCTLLPSSLSIVCTFRLTSLSSYPDYSAILRSAHHEHRCLASGVTIPDPQRRRQPCFP